MPINFFSAFWHQMLVDLWWLYELPHVNDLCPFTWGYLWFIMLRSRKTEKDALFFHFFSRPGWTQRYMHPFIFTCPEICVELTIRPAWKSGRWTWPVWKGPKEGWEERGQRLVLDLLFHGAIFSEDNLCLCHFSSNPQLEVPRFMTGLHSMKWYTVVAVWSE